MRQDTVHVRVIVPITTRGFRRPDMLRALESPGVVVSHAEIDTGPGSIECEFEAAMAAPGTVAKIIEAEREGVDAVVIDCMGDPGLRPARETVSIPVIGPGQTGMLVAAMLGHTFSVVTVLRRLRPSFENTAALAGLSSKLASVRAVDIPVLELEADLDRTQSLLVDEAVKVVEQDGAEAILFGCTGLLGCAAAVRDGLLARGIDVPVIDPIPNAVAVAAAMARLGLAQSKRTYPMPPAKQLIGYPAIALPVAQAAE